MYEESMLRTLTIYFPLPATCLDLVPFLSGIKARRKVGYLHLSRGERGGAVGEMICGSHLEGRKGDVTGKDS